MDRNNFDKFLAPNQEDRAKLKEAMMKFGYYMLIGVLTIVATVLVPFIAGGIYGDFSLYFPSTVEGWVVYWILRGTSAAMNIALFALFKLQAKQNISKEENFLKAREILKKADKKYRVTPRSPAKMEFQEWTVKGLTIILSTVVAGATISSLVLAFDIMTFLSSIAGALIGLGFGYVTMRKNEIYWTEEYLEYAEMIKEQQEAEHKAQKEKTESCCNLETENSETCKSK